MSRNMENDPMAAWMRQMANEPQERSHRPLPDPDLLWLKAQLLDRQAAVERSLRMAGWIASVARLLVGFAACLLATGLAHAVAVPAMGFLSPTQISLVVSLVLAGVAMAAFPIWSRD